MASVDDAGGHGHPHPHSEDHTHPDGEDHAHPHVAHPGGEDHAHPHLATETLPEPSGPGTVVVDIGGDIGAAVVNTPLALDGDEIEIRPDPGEWTGRHVAVRPRPLRDRTIYAAFFESLMAGEYMLRVRFSPDGAVEIPLQVTGAKVTIIDWPGTSDS